MYDKYLYELLFIKLFNKSLYDILYYEILGYYV